MERKELKSQISFIINENYNENVELKSYRGMNCDNFSKYISKELKINNDDIFNKIKHLFPNDKLKTFKYENDSKTICCFRGEYKFLSNFYKTNFKYKNLTFMTSEHAYQWEKAKNNNYKEKIYKANSPREAKNISKEVVMIDNWNTLKYNLMYGILKCKFKNLELKKKLLDTENKELIEGNYWHDNIWGECCCKGCLKKDKSNINNLGKILMKIRKELKL